MEKNVNLSILKLVYKYAVSLESQRGVNLIVRIWYHLNKNSEQWSLENVWVVGTYWYDSRVVHPDSTLHQLLGSRPLYQKVASLIPFQDTCPGSGLDPPVGGVQEAVSPCFFLSLPASLKNQFKHTHKNNPIFWKEQKIWTHFTKEDVWKISTGKDAQYH